LEDQPGILTRREMMRTGVAAMATSTLGTSFAWAETTDTNNITGRHSLRHHAYKRGLLTGFAVNTDLLASNPTYARILAEQASILVPEVALKWVPLRPAPDKFDFTRSDALVDFARQHNIKLRGHTLVWHEAIPSWFATTVTSENAKQYLEDHISTVVGRYKGKMLSWDVVNEAVLPADGRPDGLRNSPWMKLLGPDYIEIAFRATRKADPHLILTYNDYGVEYDNEEDTDRRRYILELLRGLKAKGVPLDALGIQSHIKAAFPAAIGSGLREYMAAARNLGLQIFITELDVNEDDLPFDDVAKRDEVIARTYTNFLTVALAEPAVKAVLLWGLSDSHTWLNNGPTHHRKQPNRPQRSLLFDKDYKPKPAFFAVRDAFDRRPKF
jgi:endo-1,4-beta-xylanase